MSQPNVLIVEDDAAALMLTRRVLSKELGLLEPDVAVDGAEAVSKITHAVETGNLPIVVLLDWNLPKKHGREVLTEIRNNPVTANLPVIIVTSSNAGPDQEEAFGLGANDFVHKSLSLDEFKTSLADTCRKYLH
ncbi:MAG: response regulator [Gammaproteobacteria bacterium]|nr:response regulator [Gammaproteobacteria bacterium]